MPHPKKGDAALRRIKAYIQEKGWTQHKALDSVTGAVCLSHACWSVGSHYDVRIEAEKRLQRAVWDDNAYVSITGWNDKSGRTVEEVYALIDQTIKED